MPKSPQKLTPAQRMHVFAMETFEDMASKTDINKLIEVFVEQFKKLKDEVSNLITENRVAMSTETARLGREVADFEKRIREVVDGNKSETLREVKEKVNELSALIGYVESTIEKYDDTELREHMEEMREEMKKAPEGMEMLPELKKEIEELEAKYEELENRIIRVGSGGVTNMRIRQAFKYLLHTESPTGDIDGVNLSYTVANPIFAVLSFSLNGETIAELPNYTVSGRTITFSSALPAVYSGKDFEIRYIG